MRIAWDKSAKAILIRCDTNQEFDTMMNLIQEKTKCNYSVEIPD